MKSFPRYPAVSAAGSFISYKLLALCFMLSVGILFCWMLYPEKANSGPYLDSAHAQSYGVNRNGLSSFNYSIGNCAHCHEQHASIGGTEPVPSGGVPSKYELFQALFTSPASGFCFGCHKDMGSSEQSSIPYQYNYSRIAGGDTNTCPSDVKTAFKFYNASGIPQSNCSSSVGSSHFLADIQTFLTGRWNFGGTTGNINPCSGCHNPHSAEKDPHTSTGRFVAGILVSSVSRPSLHSKDNNAWYIFTQTVLPYGYKATCRYPWSDPCTSFEPDGSTTSDGSNMVDSNYICLDCHQNSIVNITPHPETNPAHTLQAIVSLSTLWTGDVHGGAYQTCCDWGDKKAPYTDVNHYTLSCLDCHEPHGSPNEYLLRQEVNGIQIPNFSTHKYWNFCNACHTNLGTKHTGSIGPTTDCWGCHQHGASQSKCNCSPAKTF